MSDTIILDNRTSWLEFRRQHIGGSDVSAILGQNPWKSCFALWAEKTGQIEGGIPDEPDNGPVRWGKILEGPVADEYARVTGRTLIDPGPYTVRVHGRLPFVSVTLDREIVDPKRGANDPGVYEGKTTGQHRAEEWREGAPLMPQIQVQHGLAVTGWRWGSVACLIGGQEFQSMDLERNDDLVEMIEDRCEWFWDLVARREAPPVDASESTASALKRIFATDNGETVKLPAEAVEWARELARVKAVRKDLEAREQGLKNSLMAAIGEASFGELPDGTKFSLKVVNVAGYTKVVEPSSYRKLIEIKPRGKR